MALGEPTLAAPPDFSLVVGGPLYGLWRRTHLVKGELQLLRRRIVVLTMFAWLPLLLLTLAQGNAWGGHVRLPFLHDVEMHVRLLLAVPLLILAEVVVHGRMRPVVDQFLERDLIPEVERQRFDAAIRSALRLRNSHRAELCLLALVYGVGMLVIWPMQVVIDVSSWHHLTGKGPLELSWAGWWMVLVSLPLFQFLLLRWYFRWFIWARFLWQVSRIRLAIIASHPDGCGGLAFLSALHETFAPVLLAQAALLAGGIADRIFFAGAQLVEFKADIAGLVIITALAVLGPLLVFFPQLEEARRVGRLQYGSLAQRYVREFERKWRHGGAPAGEPFLGSADIQSLADLGSSFAVVKEMKLVPFTLRTVLELMLMTLSPVAPLLLTMIPLDQLLERVLSLAF